MLDLNSSCQLLTHGALIFWTMARTEDCGGSFTISSISNACFATAPANVPVASLNFLFKALFDFAKTNAPAIAAITTTPIIIHVEYSGPESAIFEYTFH